MPEINWQIMLSQTITFLIMLAIVWKFGWKPMIKFMNDRSEKVRKTLDEAENAKQSIAKLEADYRAKIEQMEQKSAELVAQARQEAAKTKEEIVTAAHQEAAEQQKKSRDQLEADRRKVMSEMRAEIVGLAMAVAEKALKEPVSGGVHDRKFREILEELLKRAAAEAVMRERYVAREYARLLLRHASGECASIKAFFTEIGKAMAAEPRLASLLCHPAIPKEEKLRVLTSMAKTPPGSLVERMLADLVKRRIIGLFGAIAEEMDVLADEARNIVAVSVTSAAALPEALRAAIIDKLAAYTGGAVKADFSVDPALVSGLLVRIGDTIIDNTIKTDLEHIRQRLLAVSST